MRNRSCSVGIAMFACLSAVALACSGTGRVEQSEYTLPGNQEALRTDFQLKAGDVLEITASGTIKMGLATGWNGPEGSGSKWILRKSGQFPAGALIGAVVNQNRQPDFFLVGTETEIEASRDGRLNLFVNEAILADNQGAFEVVVRRHRLNSFFNHVARVFG